MATNTKEHINESTPHAAVGGMTAIVPAALEIHIGTIESIVSVLVVLFAIGVAWGRLRKTVAHIEEAFERFDRRVVPKLHDVGERVAAIEGKLDTLCPIAGQRRTRKRTGKANRATAAR